MKIRLLLFCIFIPILMFSQNIIEKGFTQQSFPNDLSSNTINTITQDYWGALWIGTDNGLCRFDGYSFSIIKGYEDNISNSPSNNFIKKIYQDKKKRTWIGMHKGLCIYNDSTHTYNHLPAFKNIYINTFKEDDNNNIWVGSHDGVHIICSDTQKMHYISPEESSELSGKKVNFISIDKNHNFWFFSGYGIHRVRITKNGEKKNAYDFSDNQQLEIKSYPITGHIGFFFIDYFNQAWFSLNNTVYRMPLDKEDFDLNSAKIILKDEEYLCAYQNIDNNIWIGTRYKGIYLLKLETDGKITEIAKYWISPNQSFNITNTVTTIYGDRLGNIWAGTQNGLYALKKSNNEDFFSVKEGSTNISLSNNIVSNVFQDDEENIWLTTAYGLNKFIWKNKETNTFLIETFFDIRDKNRVEQANRFQSLIEKEKGIFWVSTKNDIVCFDKNNNTFFDDAQLISFTKENNLKMARCYHKDSKGNIWIGFEFGGVGILLANSGKFITLGSVDKTFADGDFWAITEDARGYMMLGSKRNGLYKIKINTNSIGAGNKAISFKKQYLKDEWITSILVNKDNIPWVGTSSKVYYYNANEDNFIEQKLSNSNSSGVYVSGITEDLNESLWIFTPNGIYKFDEKERSVNAYNTANNALSRINYQFNSLCSKDGSIFVGGINGLTYFYPEHLHPDSTKQKIHISDFRVLNQTKYLEKDINLLDKISLPYDENQFYFEFTTFYLTDPYKIKYSYKLEGFDKSWIYVDARRNYASYSHVPPGNYKLLIRSTNPSGEWVETYKAINITISPPIWATWWAYCIYFILIAGLIVLVIYINYVKGIYRQEKKYNLWKTELYANITNSFETPLFLLKAPLENMIGNLHNITKPEIEGLLNIMQQNVKRLLHLVKQLSEIQKIEVNQASLNIKKVDLIPFVQNAYNIFLTVAKNKGIRFEYQHAEESIEANIDSEKIEIILFNLLSYAFKNIIHNKLIIIHCYSENKEKVWIEIFYNNAEFEQKHGEDILQDYYNFNEDNDIADITKVGIGLTLAKKIIELHEGKLYIENTPGKGSTFRFYLPSQLEITEKVTKTDDQKTYKSYIESYIDIEKDLDITKSDDKIKNIQHTIFLVEKNEELATLFEKVLSQKGYKVKTFNAIDKLFASIVNLDPSLILCNWNKIEKKEQISLSKSLKNNIQASHIPILFIMDKSVSENEILEIYEAGVDACITKPFDLSYLILRINQLINIRQSIKEKMRIDESIFSEKEKTSITSSDDKFLQRIIKIVEKNIADENFNLEEFAKQANISRSVLNNKTLNLLGQTPIEFVKTFRLKKAAQLLESNAYSIAEISLMVGFTDAGYFSTCFKKQYEETPSEYVKNKKKKEKD